MLLNVEYINVKKKNQANIKIINSEYRRHFKCPY